MRKADNLADLTNLYYIITWEYSLRIYKAIVHGIYSQIHITCNPFLTMLLFDDILDIHKSGVYSRRKSKRLTCDMNWTVFLINNRLEHVLKKVIVLKVNFLWDLVEKWRSLRKTLLMTCPVCHGQSVHVCPYPSAFVDQNSSPIKSWNDTDIKKDYPTFILEIQSPDWSSQYIKKYELPQALV